MRSSNNRPIWTACIFCAWVFVSLVHAETREKTPYDGIIQDAAQRYGIKADLIHSIIKAESDYDSRAVSPKGAVGLMQLMPATAKAYGVRDRFNPVENIEGGVKYLKDLAALYNKKWELVLAAYNAGQEAVRKYGGIPPYRETINYINRVKSRYPEAFVRRSTKIYRFVDEKGRTVLTDDYYLYKRYINKQSRK